MDQRRVEMAEGKAAAGLRVSWYLLERMRWLPVVSVNRQPNDLLLLDLQAAR